MSIKEEKEEVCVTPDDGVVDLVSSPDSPPAIPSPVLAPDSPTPNELLDIAMVESPPKTAWEPATPSSGPARQANQVSFLFFCCFFFVTFLSTG